MKALTWNDEKMQRRRQEYLDASTGRRQEMRWIWQQTVERLENMSAGRRRRGEYLHLAVHEEATAQLWRDMLDWAEQHSTGDLFEGIEA